MAQTSAADLAHGLKGTHFPIDKQGLVEKARQNGAPREVMDAIQQMPDQQYGSISEVEHQFSQANKGRGGTSPQSTSAARKGGQDSHGGRRQ